MVFRKQGIAPIEEIKCSCGHDLKGHTSACPNCGKTLIPVNLQTTPQDTPSEKEEPEAK